MSLREKPAVFAPTFSLPIAGIPSHWRLPAAAYSAEGGEQAITN